MLTIVNYNLGNIHAIKNIYGRLNIPVNIAATSDELKTATRIILPGVGAFDAAMERLNRSGMRQVLDDLVLIKKVPVLGICVGMQMMAMDSEEGTESGLGWIDAKIMKFEQEKMNSQRGICLPHMGWNAVQPQKQEGLFNKIGKETKFYFLHSFYILPAHKQHVGAVTNYNGRFVSSICSKNIFGVQFHPEKSHTAGIQLLKNFAEV